MPAHGFTDPLEASWLAEVGGEILGSASLAALDRAEGCDDVSRSERFPASEEVPKERSRIREGDRRDSGPAAAGLPPVERSECLLALRQASPYLVRAHVPAGDHHTPAPAKPEGSLLTPLDSSNAGEG